jgi:putative ATPase
MDLFAKTEAENKRRNQPLAARMRPRRLAEFVGQLHILGEGQLLRRMVDSGCLGSIIIAGPPGTGKTTLAHLLATETGSPFRQLSAVTSGVKELRETLAWAQDEVAAGGARPLLFIDEIHRFNRAQQDALLPDVEAGTIALVGATTSNPFFAINSALLSRSQLFQLQALTVEQIVELLRRALLDKERGLGNISVQVDEAALQWIAAQVEGDARRALLALEVAVLSTPPPVPLSVSLVQESMQRKQVGYDGTGDDHYDLASALIKSIRGSDVDAAMYWLARMLDGGEEIRFITRRLVILASEDIGNADPAALSLAVAAMQACEFIGLPECQLTLSQTVAYLALAPKSNAATTAIGAALRDVKQRPLAPVPLHLRDAHYPGADQLGHGKDYQYSHDYTGGVAKQVYLEAEQYLGYQPDYYQPTGRGHEAKLLERISRLREYLRNQAETTGQ